MPVKINSMCLQLFFQMTVIVKFYGRDTSTIQKHTKICIALLLTPPDSSPPEFVFSPTFPGKTSLFLSSATVFWNQVDISYETILTGSDKFLLFKYQ